mmetsp:Transcript_14903/g.30318  ORF Transcript_14903/g.30318 Transcript_14903/m.30318 type:complete len:104 (-) Transcript_14903:1959-2270(-)
MDKGSSLICFASGFAGETLGLANVWGGCSRRDEREWQTITGCLTGRQNLGRIAVGGLAVIGAVSVIGTAQATVRIVCVGVLHLVTGEGEGAGKQRCRFRFPVS